MNYRQFNNLQLPPTSNYAPAPPPPYSYYPPANASGGSSPTRQTRARFSSHRFTGSARTPVVYPPRRAVTPSYAAYPPPTLQTRYDAVAPSYAAQYGAQASYRSYSPTPAPNTHPTAYNPYLAPPHNEDWWEHPDPFTPSRNPRTLVHKGALDQRYAGESRAPSKLPKVRVESRRRSGSRSPPPVLRKPSLSSSMASTTTLHSSSWHSSEETLHGRPSDNRKRIAEHRHAVNGNTSHGIASSRDAYDSVLPHHREAKRRH
ncbi:hypothetical protein PENSPDRAFT_687057 [Peniophora sp. CONT]|nr:hypothetical protein PENSPDRAFT_687057 [Peniophora sp. CONT]